MSSQKVDFSRQDTYFRQLAEHIPQMVWTAGPDGMVDWVNQTWCQYTGLTLEQSLGTGWRLAIHPDEADSTAERWRQAWQDGRDYEITYRWRRHDGVYRWFLGRATPIKDAHGNTVAWFGTITDIHDSKLAKDRLESLVHDKDEDLQRLGDILSNFVESGDFRRASRELLKLALTATQSEYGFIGATVDGGPQGMTLRVFADEGFHWSPTVNRDLYEKIVSDYQTKGYIEFPLLDNLFGWPLKNGEPIIANEPHRDSRRSGRTPAGHPPLNNFLGVPIYKGEQVVGMFGVANRPSGYTQEDVQSIELLAKTASVIYENYRRQQQEHTLVQERQLAEARLRESNRSLLDLAYIVSHELQEPLRVIKSDLSLLAVRYQDRLGTDADEFIRNASSAAHTVERMVDDLWEFARIDRPHIQLEAIELNELFDKTLITLQDLITARGAVVTREPLPRVAGERRQLAMVFRQLISNAIKFNDSDKPEVHLSVKSMVDVYHFELKDNGIGFEPTEVSEVFKMFRKLDRDTPGTGMGLAIAKRVVEFHGGKMWAASTRGVGSTFYFTLPMNPPARG